jgi:hypothetical protein
LSDWRDQLSALHQDIHRQEKAVDDKKAAIMTAFRQRLAELGPILKNVTEFGDAFGVDITWEISRFDQRYPSLSFSIHKPALTLAVECRDGLLHERFREGIRKVQERVITLDDIVPRQFEQRVTKWVEGAANANRKVPGKGK